LPNPQAGGLPLVGSPRLLVHYICNYPPYWKLFLHLQPEDAPCHDDTDPLIIDPSFRSILISPPNYTLIFQVVSFPQVFPPKPCMHLFSLPYVLRAASISFCWFDQGRPVGGASGALAPRAPKRRSPTGHSQRIFFKFGCIGFSLF
jgi:hypothetical protein